MCVVCVLLWYVCALSNPGLRELPPELGQLGNLWQLDVEDLNISNVPAEIDLFTFLCKRHFFSGNIHLNCSLLHWLYSFWHLNSEVLHLYLIIDFELFNDRK